MTNDTDKALTLITMETNTLESTKMANGTDKAPSLVPMAPNTSVTSEQNLEWTAYMSPNDSSLRLKNIIKVTHQGMIVPS